MKYVVFKREDLFRIYTNKTTAKRLYDAYHSEYVCFGLGYRTIISVLKHIRYDYFENTKVPYGGFTHYYRDLDYAREL